MGNITQVEMSAIREIAGGHLNVATKLNEYAQKCTDPTIKNMFENAAQEAKKSAQALASML